MVSEVKEWYKGRSKEITFPDEIIKNTILASLPEVLEITEIYRKKPEPWQREPESAYIKVTLQNGVKDGVHVYQTTNGKIRAHRRWDGSWGRTDVINGKKIKVWPGYDMDPMVGVAQGVLFK